MTDNASNFVKAFQEFGTDSLESEEYCGSIEETNEEWESDLDKNDDLNPKAMCFHNLSDLALSKHIRCASHTVRDVTQSHNTITYFPSTIQSYNTIIQYTQIITVKNTCAAIVASGSPQLSRCALNPFQFSLSLTLEPNSTK